MGGFGFGDDDGGGAGGRAFVPGGPGGVQEAYGSVASFMHAVRATLLLLHCRVPVIAILIRPCVAWWLPQRGTWSEPTPLSDARHISGRVSEGAGGRFGASLACVSFLYTSPSVSGVPGMRVVVGAPQHSRAALEGGGGECRGAVRAKAPCDVHRTHTTMTFIGVSDGI